MVIVSIIRNIQWILFQKKLNKIDRLSKIREKARVIEQAVNRKEQLMKFNGAHSVSDKINVNDMLINAIEAKLKVLEDL